jgi:hypothetical protein
MRKDLILGLLCMAMAVSACGGDSSSDGVGRSAGNGGTAGSNEEAGVSRIDSCDDIDASGLSSGTIDSLAAKYEGMPCTSPLQGGDPGMLQECGYGGDLLVCGQNAGLWEFGCSCWTDSLSCTNGAEVKAAQERLCADGGSD